MNGYRFVSAACLVFALCYSAWAGPMPVDGRWQITATIIATSTPQGKIREGFTKQETWTITQQGAMATLTTPSGSVQGTFQDVDPDFPGGAWRFTLETPYALGQPNLAARYEAIISWATANTIKGSSSVTFYGNSGGFWSPIGMESWKFEGLRMR
ncbi:MAG: hypothetical protein EOM25_08245 [Deltaproteobacteria bacterium]|nr:hypothetical protein [Deltaproteobacteria bacterium]